MGCSSSKSLIERKPYLYVIQKLDGSQINVKSHFIDSLSNEYYDTLKKHLNSISYKEINFDKKIIINFIDNDPRINKKNYQVPWDIFYGNIEKDLSKHGQSNHFWIINKRVKHLYYYHGDKINWIVDENNLIREMFFNYDGLNGGFVIIKPNGKYFLKIGEYRKSDFLKTCNQF